MDDTRKTKSQLLEETARLRADLLRARARAESAESLAAGRHRDVLVNVGAVMIETDQHGNFTYVSPSITEVLGYLPSEALELREDAWLHDQDRGELVELFRKILSSGQSGKVVIRARHRDGHWLWLETTLNRYRDAEGVMHSVALARDVSAERDQQEALRRGEARYRRLADVSREWITESDAEGRILYASANSKELLGLGPDRMVGTTPYLRIHPDDVSRVVEGDLECSRSRTPFSTAPYRLRHADGTWRWVESRGCTYTDSDGQPVVLRATRDITERMEAVVERRDLEARIQQTQKLESLGVMAGGIAHDFNNLLTPILGDTSLALLDLPADSPIRLRLQKVQAAAHRAAALTNQMLAYSGEEPLHVETVNLSALVQEMGQLLETAASREAVLVYQLERGLPLVEADAARLSQVVMNLVTNASEALENDEGRIALRTGVVNIDAHRLALAVVGSELATGEYVFFEVADSGCGMDADTRTRIFDPFFSTKFAGRGLGLASVLGIVRAHRGAIELESAPGEGTTFRVLFPGTARRFSSPAARESEIQNWRSSGTILVIDDEEGVRDLCAETLERAGFSVICGSDGREGILLFERHADEIRAVLLDRTMPNTSGEEAFDRIRKIRPDSRIILVSGYSQKRAEQRFVGKGLDSFLKKPFLPTALLQTVRDVLEKS